MLPIYMNTILQMIQSIINNDFSKNYTHAEEALLQHVKINPHDTDAWLLLMRIECNSPLEDPSYITNYAKAVLAYDNHNAYALLFLAYAQYYMLGGIESETYTLLCAADDPNPEIMAMIEIAKAHYWENKEKSSNFVEALQKSISYSHQQAFNYIYLGKWYMSNGKSDLGKEYIKKGLHNVKKITTFDDTPDGYDPLSIIDLFNEFYTGTQMSEVYYAYIQSFLLQ